MREVDLVRVPVRDRARLIEELGLSEGAGELEELRMGDIEAVEVLVAVDEEVDVWVAVAELVAV